MAWGVAGGVTRGVAGEVAGGVARLVTSPICIFIKSNLVPYISCKVNKASLYDGKYSAITWLERLI